MAFVQIAAAIAAALAAAVGGWMLDARLTRSRGSLRSMFCVVLLAVTAGLGTVILLEPWLMAAEVPADALWMFRMRVLSLFVMLGCVVLAISMVLVTIAALFMSHVGPKWRLCVLPVLGLAAFALVLFLVGTHQFRPTA